MTDAAVRLLSLANQLNYTSRRVLLNFEEGEPGTMGYLNRMGFFDHLAAEIAVYPARPMVSGVKAYGRTNGQLVEIARISPSMRDKELPTRLSKAVSSVLAAREDATTIEGAIWTVFAELIDNIFSHSATVLDGYAAMQLYKQGNGLQVVVSDSGKGIMDTLRPTIQAQHPVLAGLSDADLLVEVFRQGISRHGSDRGCGLKGSAEKAMKYKADLEVRLPQCRVVLRPANGKYEITSNRYESLPLLWGTHISFRFALETIQFESGSMKPMNEIASKIKLLDLMDAPYGWGRDQGREIFPKLIKQVEANPIKDIIEVSLLGVERTDISFASETVVEIARRFRGSKGFYLTHIADEDLLENWDAAALKKAQPLMVWDASGGKVIGLQPSQGNLAAFEFVLKEGRVTTADLVTGLDLQVTNASTKLKQLWEQGFLLRRQEVAESGGTEFVYFAIK